MPLLPAPRGGISLLVDLTQSMHLHAMCVLCVAGARVCDCDMNSNMNSNMHVSWNMSTCLLVSKANLHRVMCIL